MPHDFKHAFAEVSMYLMKVKSRPTYLSGLGAIGLPTKRPLSFKLIP